MVSSRVLALRVEASRAVPSVLVFVLVFYNLNYYEFVFVCVLFKIVWDLKNVGNDVATYGFCGVYLCYISLFRKTKMLLHFGKSCVSVWTAHPILSWSNLFIGHVDAKIRA